MFGGRRSSLGCTTHNKVIVSPPNVQVHGVQVHVQVRTNVSNSPNRRHQHI
jgi:hypothetical protein